MHNKYDLIFDAYQEDPSMEDADFCQKHGFTLDELSKFWSGDMPKPGTKEIEVVKHHSRTLINQFRDKWNKRGFDPQKLLGCAERFFGIPHDKWTFKAWMMFYHELSDPNSPKYQMFDNEYQSFSNYIDSLDD